MFLPFLFAALMHPVHETVSEVQWNPHSHRVEVALRLSVLDEQWIQQNQSDENKEVKVWAIRYLSKTFRLDPDKSKNAKPSTYHWVGRKDEGAHVWWFFEIQPADNQPPKLLSQRMLFDREQGYANRVLILAPSTGDPKQKGQSRKDATVPRRSVTLTIQRPTTKLDTNADDDQDAEPR